MLVDNYAHLLLVPISATYQNIYNVVCSNYNTYYVASIELSK